jgi:branched-chain amino acid transport system substrate-binding protein
MLLGTTVEADGYDFMVLENMMLYDGDQIITPVGQESIEWLGTLTPDFLDQVKAETFSHGS